MFLSPLGGFSFTCSFPVNGPVRGYFVLVLQGLTKSECVQCTEVYIHFLGLVKGRGWDASYQIFSLPGSERFCFSFPWLVVIVFFSVPETFLRCVGWSQLNGDIRVPQQYRHCLARSDSDKEQSHVLPDNIIGTAWFVLTLLTCW